MPSVKWESCDSVYNGETSGISNAGSTVAGAPPSPGLSRALPTEISIPFFTQAWFSPLYTKVTHSSPSLYSHCFFLIPSPYHPCLQSHSCFLAICSRSQGSICTGVSICPICYIPPPPPFSQHCLSKVTNSVSTS